MDGVVYAVVDGMADAVVDGVEFLEDQTHDVLDNSVDFPPQNIFPLPFFASFSKFTDFLTFSFTTLVVFPLRLLPPPFFGLGRGGK